METILEASAKTPLLTLSKETSCVVIKGRLIPEDPEIIFNKIRKAIDIISQQDQKLTFDIELEYFNTSSARFLYDLLMHLKEIGNSCVIWRYEEDDEDIFESGKELQEMTGLDFEYDML